VAGGVSPSPSPVVGAGPAGPALRHPAWRIILGRPEDVKTSTGSTPEDSEEQIPVIRRTQPIPFWRQRPDRQPPPPPGVRHFSPAVPTDARSYVDYTFTRTFIAATSAPLARLQERRQRDRAPSYELPPKDHFRLCAVSTKAFGRRRCHSVPAVGPFPGKMARCCDLNKTRQGTDNYEAVQGTILQWGQLNRPTCFISKWEQARSSSRGLAVRQSYRGVTNGDTTNPPYRHGRRVREKRSVGLPGAAYSVGFGLFADATLHQRLLTARRQTAGASSCRACSPASSSEANARGSHEEN